MVCPARCGLTPGQFDVVEGPAPRYRFDRLIGWRVDEHSGVGVCVHPYRIGLPSGRYASADQPLPADPSPEPHPSAAALRLPEDLTDLEGWLVAVLRVVHADQLGAAVEQAEATAAARFPAKQVTAALRQVLSRELARRG